MLPTVRHEEPRSSSSIRHPASHMAGVANPSLTQTGNPLEELHATAYLDGSGRGYVWSLRHAGWGLLGRVGIDAPGSVLSRMQG
jgi:hypothetical protein